MQNSNLFCISLFVLYDFMYYPCSNHKISTEPVINPGKPSPARIPRAAPSPVPW